MPTGRQPKLTPHDVHTIDSLYALGFTRGSISSIFGLAPETITNVTLRRDCYEYVKKVESEWPLLAFSDALKLSPGPRANLEVLERYRKKLQEHYNATAAAVNQIPRMLPIWRHRRAGPETMAEAEISLIKGLYEVGVAVKSLQKIFNRCHLSIHKIVYGEFGETVAPATDFTDLPIKSANELFFRPASCLSPKMALALAEVVKQFTPAAAGAEAQPTQKAPV